MRKIININLIFVILISSCNTKPIIIDPDLLKYDWASDVYDFKIENDSLAFQTFLRDIGQEEIDWVASYKISYDTLFIFDSYNTNTIKPTTFKYKIVKVDSFKLILKEIPPKFNDTLVFNKQIHTKKNDLKFDRIEFYSSSSWIGPVQSLIIGSDSILYHYGYFNTKHEGLSKYKLSPVEFSRIENRFHYINWNILEVESPAPSTSSFSLFVKTPNDSIEISGRYLRDNVELNDFIAYLRFIERFLNLNPIEDEEVSFRYSW